MSRTKSLPVVLVLLALSISVLASCGGEDDSSEPTTAARSGDFSEGPANEGPSNTGGDSREVAPGQDRGVDKGPEKRGGKEQADSLATDPRSIPRTLVTGTGVVQTLQPNSRDRAEAMENSYASIREYGAEATKGEATDITFALVQYLTAKAEGDWATACARLYSVLKDRLLQLAAKSEDPALRGSSCPQVYGLLLQPGSAAAAAEAARIDVAAVRRQDEHAFVIYKTPDTLSADMPMYLEGGVWTVGAIDAYVLTPAQAGSAP